ncbi:hypothetical protein ACIQU6_30570 [Streptomyces sp. NPDC090442]|uniref:hypothetical protein n=1 Tax=Streptomyces sp. NPDC090442 TaxID=3365962 RepID=UPI0037FBCE95
MSLKKDVASLFRQVQRQGFVVRRNPNTNHFRVTAPDGQCVTVPSTPNGSPQNLLTIRSKLRRIGAVL